LFVVRTCCAARRVSLQPEGVLAFRFFRLIFSVGYRQAELLTIVQFVHLSGFRHSRAVALQRRLIRLAAAGKPPPVVNVTPGE
jgi:hypothetical protein